MSASLSECSEKDAPVNQHTHQNSKSSVELLDEKQVQGEESPKEDPKKSECVIVRLLSILPEFKKQHLLENEAFEQSEVLCIQLEMMENLHCGLDSVIERVLSNLEDQQRNQQKRQELQRKLVDLMRERDEHINEIKKLAERYRSFLRARNQENNGDNQGMGSGPQNDILLGFGTDIDKPPIKTVDECGQKVYEILSRDNVMFSESSPKESSVSEQIYSQSPIYSKKLVEIQEMSSEPILIEFKKQRLQQKEELKESKLLCVQLEISNLHYTDYHNQYQPGQQSIMRNIENQAQHQQERNELRRNLINLLKVKIRRFDQLIAEEKREMEEIDRMIEQRRQKSDSSDEKSTRRNFTNK